MNFFAAQDRARKQSRRLVMAYIVATILIVAGVTAVVTFAMFKFTRMGAGTHSATEFFIQNWTTSAGIAAVTAALIFGASMFKTAVLSSGGGQVARQVGGTLVPTDVQDPLRRRLRNVVEEMAIASGLPVPEIYVLEEESGINAFAAGFTSSDAAVAVTRGALEQLERDELQGVIAHEFSHILNGDMRLNIRLMGVLFGIMMLTLIGRLIIRGGYHTSIVSSRRDRGTPVVLIIGVGLAVLGAIGMFFARIIKAGVSRQREYLADASAVQYTRQKSGIANALKKIGGFSEGSYIKETDPEEVSHMLFGSGSKFIGMFATHPPIIDRIQALDSSFDESDFANVNLRQQTAFDASEATAGFAGNVASEFASGGDGLLVESIAASVGQPSNKHVQYAQKIRQSIPESLYSAAHSPEFSYLLTIALVLDRSGQHVDRQFGIAREQLGTDRATLVQRYYDELATTGPEFRLPLLEIAFPALKQRPHQELSFLVTLTNRLIEVDGEVDLYEYCFYRILTSSLDQAVDPSTRRRAGRGRRANLRAATVTLLRVLANYGHDDEEQQQAAYHAGVETLGEWAQQFEYSAASDNSVAALDHSLDVLLGLNSEGKESLLRAISATAGSDGRISVAEAELIRAVCATLEFPLPPILVQN